MYPNLAGHNALYLQHAPQAYKKGKGDRQGVVVIAFVSRRQDEDIADLAAYNASLGSQMRRAAVGLPCWDGVGSGSVRNDDNDGTDFRVTKTSDVVQAQLVLVAVLLDG